MGNDKSGMVLLHNTDVTRGENSIRRLERDRAELIAALELCYDHCRLYHPEVESNNVGEAVRSVLSRIRSE